MLIIKLSFICFVTLGYGYAAWVRKLTRDSSVEEPWPPPMISPLVAADGYDGIYLYGGGNQCGAFSRSKVFSALWYLNTTSLKWSLIFGNASIVDEQIKYGNFLEYSPNAIPGARCGGSAYYDRVSGTFNLLGGKLLVNSMFEFNLTRNLWRWSYGVQFPDFYDFITAPGYSPTPRIFEQSFFDHDLRLLFVFGGYRGNGGFYFNDMWIFDLANTTAWRTSATDTRIPAGYGEVGVPSRNAWPDGRYGASTSYDTNSKVFYMFGGYGFDSVGNIGHLSDMWTFSVRTSYWTFFGGSKLADSLGVYGPIGESSALYYPRSRFGGYSAVSKSGLFYMFGGIHAEGESDANQIAFQMSDLWRYNSSTSDWVLLFGNETTSSRMTRTGLNVESELNNPGARSEGVAFFDDKTNSLVIWGGKAVLSDTQVVTDLWVFHDNYTSVPKTTRISTSRTSIVSTRTSIKPTSVDGIVQSSVLVSILSTAVAVTVAFVLGYIIMRQVRGRRAKKESNFEGDSYTYETKDSVESTDILKQQVTHGTTMLVVNEGLEIPGYLEFKASHFSFVKQIAAGGGGEVYLAVPVTEHLKQFCIIMVAKTTNENSRSFFQEISIMHLLSDSPFIARILGFCLDPRTILMKYYETGTMEDYFKKDENVSLSLKLCFASDIAKGVEALHAVGISHNDLKPQNILLDITKDRLVCVITDFGISSVLNHDLLSIEAFVVANLRGVSLRYAAPEAIRRFRERQPSNSATVDVFKAGDMYSTGSIYCFLFTNVEPWSIR